MVVCFCVKITLTYPGCTTLEYEYDPIIVFPFNNMVKGVSLICAALFALFYITVDKCIFNPLCISRWLDGHMVHPVFIIIFHLFNITEVTDVKPI